MTATIDLDWRQHATCRSNPDLFFTDSKEHNARAAHLCTTHCPVLEPCRRDAVAAKPVHCVQAGIVWVGPLAGRDGRMGAYQPKARGCGPECGP